MLVSPNTDEKLIIEFVWIHGDNNFEIAFQKNNTIFAIDYSVKNTGTEE